MGQLDGGREDGCLVLSGSTGGPLLGGFFGLFGRYWSGFVLDA